MARDGVVAQDRNNLLTFEPPPRPLLSAEASRYFFDVAATPPGQGQSTASDLAKF